MISSKNNLVLNIFLTIKTACTINIMVAVVDMRSLFRGHCRHVGGRYYVGGGLIVFDLCLIAFTELSFIYLMHMQNVETWGQFHQPSGAKRKCAGRHPSALFRFTNKTVSNFTIAPN
jgi:hypothetical protein